MATSRCNGKILVISQSKQEEAFGSSCLYVHVHVATPMQSITKLDQLTTIFNLTFLGSSWSHCGHGENYFSNMEEA